MSEREHAAGPVNAAFDQGCWRRRPRSSTAAASSVAPIARAPASPRTGISLKRNPAPPATSPSCGQQPLQRGPSRSSRHRAAETAPRRILGHHPPRDKEHHLASRKCRRESTPQSPVNAAFDQGCRRRRPRSSTAAASSVAPIARAPASPRTGISLKRNRRRRRPHHLRPAAAAPARAGRAGIAPPKLRRAGFSATTRQGIKNTISPAGNVGERARRRA